MATPNKKFNPEFAGVAARALLMLGGLAALAWAANCFELIRKSSDIEKFAEQVVAGNSFSDATMKEIVAQLYVTPASDIASAAFARSSANIRLRYLDGAFLGAVPQAIFDRIVEVREALTVSFLLAPSDSFLWFSKFWIENNDGGYRSENLKYLENSYRLGPREQWIAERRNRVALVIFSKLTPATQQLVVDEFASLVQNNLLAETASIILGPGWGVRDRLLAALDSSGTVTLTRYLARHGFRINTLAIDSDGRPWR